MMLASVVLPRPGRPEDEHVIERLGALAGGADEDVELRLHLRLPDVLGQAPRPDGLVDRLVLAGWPRRRSFFQLARWVYSGAAPLRARRISSSVECVPGPAALSKRVASAGL